MKTLFKRLAWRYLPRKVRPILKRIARDVVSSPESWLTYDPSTPHGSNGPLPFWERDVRFLELFHKIEPYTMVDIIRCYLLYSLSQSVRDLEGAVAEVGVWRGGCGELVANCLPQKQVYLFDTFEGLPEVEPEHDGYDHQRGNFNDVSYEAVKERLSAYPNIQVVRGLFPDSARPLDLPRTFSFVHVDVDIYRSVLDCCSFFYPRLSPNGVMIFDDYGFLSCAGAKKAVDQFFQNLPERPIYLPSGQCMITKQWQGEPAQTVRGACHAAEA